jgi:mono/diheme cytochrome c family protein
MQTQPMRVAEYARNMPADFGAEVALGRHLAMTHCSECHGPSFGGGEPEPGAIAPDLAIVRAYDLPTFTRLLRTGTPLNDRKLRQMDVVAREEVSNLTDEEIAQVHAYLVRRAQQAP